MGYIRKTKDVYCIDTNYGSGWETEAKYDTYAEAKRDLLEYRLHTSRYGGACKIVKRKERIV